MSKENPFAEYSVSKSPMQLLEEFATEMLVGHGIQVTEVNFSDNGIYKFTSQFKPKERIKTKGTGTNINTAWTSAGRVRLGTAEEIK